MLNSNLSMQKAKKNHFFFSEPLGTPRRKQTQKPKMQENGQGLQRCVLKKLGIGR